MSLSSVLMAQNIKQDVEMYSVKGRWNIKIGHSFEKTPCQTIPLLDIIDPYYKRQSNYRIELDYSVTRWLEVGLHTGVQLHKAYYTIDGGGYADDEEFHKTYFIPTLGVNAKLHLLPFISKDPANRLEWYIVARYGGGFVGNMRYRVLLESFWTLC